MYHTGEDLSLHGEQALRGAQDTVGFTPHICKGNHDEGCGLGAVCRQRLGANPLEGAVYVFRNRAGTALKLLLYDGQGYWMMMQRLSQGRFRWWPTSPDARVPLSARALLIVLWNGNPDGAQMAQDWRRLV
jgi:transposase